MNRETALKVRGKGYPEQPAAGATDCEHRGTSRLCSCHLTLEQHGAAEELGDYTLYLFGAPYRFRVKVPHYPSGVITFDEVHHHTDAELREVSRRLKRTRSPRKRPVASVAPTAEQAPVAPAPPKRATAASPRKFDAVYNSAYAKARRRGPEAVAAFKAEWAAKKAAA